MPNSCAACGAPASRTYTISRGSVNRVASLCAEHGAPLEALLRQTSTKHRSTGSILMPIEKLKPSRATLARARAAQGDEQPAQRAPRARKGTARG